MANHGIGVLVGSGAGVLVGGGGGSVGGTAVGGGGSDVLVGGGGCVGGIGVAVGGRGVLVGGMRVGVAVACGRGVAVGGDCVAVAVAGALVTVGVAVLVAVNVAVGRRRVAVDVAAMARGVGVGLAGALVGDTVALLAGTPAGADVASKPANAVGLGRVMAGAAVNGGGVLTLLDESELFRNANTAPTSANTATAARPASQMPSGWRRAAGGATAAVGMAGRGPISFVAGVEAGVAGLLAGREMGRGEGGVAVRVAGVTAPAAPGGGVGTAFRPVGILPVMATVKWSARWPACW